MKEYRLYVEGEWIFTGKELVDLYPLLLFYQQKGKLTQIKEVELKWEYLKEEENNDNTKTND